MSKIRYIDVADHQAKTLANAMGKALDNEVMRGLLGLNEAAVFLPWHKQILIGLSGRWCRFRLWIASLIVGEPVHGYGDCPDY